MASSVSYPLFRLASKCYTSGYWTYILFVGYHRRHLGSVFRPERDVGTLDIGLETLQEE